MDFSVLQDCLISNFEDKSIFLQVSGAIEFYKSINNCKIVLDKKLLYINDCNDKNFQLDMTFFDNFSFNYSVLVIELSNDIVISIDTL